MQAKVIIITISRKFFPAGKPIKKLDFILTAPCRILIKI
jgi:hypothetical protein